MSTEQRAKLSAAQRAYVTSDPRWATHRQKLADAQIAKRMTLFSNEIELVVAMRKKGRSFSYIAEEIGIDREALRRELLANDIPTLPVKTDRRARRGKGFWRSFDEADHSNAYTRRATGLAQ
jgi:hypothetical protein